MLHGRVADQHKSHLSHHRRDVPDLRAQPDHGQRRVGLDSGRLATPCSHTNLAVCCRHVSKSPPAQMETRNTNCLLPAKSSNDANIPTKHISERALACGRTHRQRATSHWIRAPPLDGGEDEDTDTGTDRTVLVDDNEDMALTMRTWPPSPVHRYPKPVTSAHAHPRGRTPLQMGLDALDFEDLFEEHSVSSYTFTSSLNQLSQYRACSVHTARHSSSTTYSTTQVAHILRGAQLLRIRTPRRHSQIFPSSHRLGARLFRHSDCAICPRSPFGHGVKRLHLCQNALYSKTRVPSHITSTLKFLCSAVGNRSARRSSTSRKTGLSPRILPATATWL